MVNHGKRLSALNSFRPMHNASSTGVGIEKEKRGKGEQKRHAKEKTCSGVRKKE